MGASAMRLRGTSRGRPEASTAAVTARGTPMDDSATHRGDRATATPSRAFASRSSAASAAETRSHARPASVTAVATTSPSRAASDGVCPTEARKPAAHAETRGRDASARAVHPRPMTSGTTHARRGADGAGTSSTGAGASRSAP